MDLQEWKLDLATKCGADLVFNPSQCQVQDEIDKLTDGYGCDACGNVHMVELTQVLNWFVVAVSSSCTYTGLSLL